MQDVPQCQVCPQCNSISPYCPAGCTVSATHRQVSSASYKEHTKVPKFSITSNTFKDIDFTCQIVFPYLAMTGHQNQHKSTKTTISGCISNDVLSKQGQLQRQTCQERGVSVTTILISVPTELESGLKPVAVPRSTVSCNCVKDGGYIPSTLSQHWAASGSSQRLPQ